MNSYGKNYYYEKDLKSRNVNFSGSMESLTESFKNQSITTLYDVFLSHSSVDKNIVLNFNDELIGFGFKVYIDWINDANIERNEISEKLKIAMDKSNTLIYLHTHNSRNSKWTPWELGFFDSLKGGKKIGVVPLLDNSKRIASYKGQEYLEQYTQIGKTKLKDFVKNGVGIENNWLFI